MSPFERIKPWAVYVTPQETVQVKALTTLELAVCAAPGKGTYPTRLIAPQDIDGEARGKGHNQRYVHNIFAGRQARRQPAGGGGVDQRGLHQLVPEPQA